MRNIQNPKELFTRADREQFVLLLGLDQGDLPSSPRSPKSLKKGGQRIASQPQQQTKSVERKLTKQPSQVKVSQRTTNAASHIDYIDQRSLDYHKKIMDRA